MKNFYRWFDRFVNVIFFLAILFILFIIARVFLFATFRIPSDSMEPTTIKGDIVWVCKPIIGARLFNIFKAIRGKDIDVYRLPGFSKIKRNDVLVFNFPYSEWNKWDDIKMQLSDYYIKRCIAIPGDTLFIHDGIYQIGNSNIIVGNLESQKKIMRFDPKNIPIEQYITLPFDTVLKWNIREFGPLYIPRKNDSISTNRTNFLLYKKIIEWEQGAKLELRDKDVYINNVKLTGYRFKNNYYFMGGDNSMKSVDSRFWGLIPEDFIVGKASFILSSYNSDIQKYRWNRFLKKIE